MRKKIMIYILMAVGTLFLLTGCKKNVGTPEDNAVRAMIRKKIRIRRKKSSVSAGSICRIRFMQH